MIRGDGNVLAKVITIEKKTAEARSQTPWSVYIFILSNRLMMM